MKDEPSLWGTLGLAVAAALALAFLLSGCASGRPEPAPKAAADTWGSCDRSLLVRVMLICRQTKTEPVSDLRR